MTDNVTNSEMRSHLSTFFANEGLKVPDEITAEIAATFATVRRAELVKMLRLHYGHLFKAQP